MLLCRDPAVGAAVGRGGGGWGGGRRGGGGGGAGGAGRSGDQPLPEHLYPHPLARGDARGCPGQHRPTLHLQKLMRALPRYITG